MPDRDDQRFMTGEPLKEVSVIRDSKPAKQEVKADQVIKPADQSGMNRKKGDLLKHGNLLPIISICDGIQRAFFAAGYRPAICFPRVHNQGMILVVKRDVFGEGPHNKRLQCVIGHVRGNHAMSPKNPPGIGVDHKNGLIGGIEQDAVRRFLSDAVDGKQLIAE